MNTKVKLKTFKCNSCGFTQKTAVPTLWNRRDCHRVRPEGGYCYGRYQEVGS